MTPAPAFKTALGVSTMPTSIAACDHCDADVTFRPDPDHELIMHVDVAHDDDCKFYLALAARRKSRA